MVKATLPQARNILRSTSTFQQPTVLGYGGAAETMIQLRNTVVDGPYCGFWTGELYQVMLSKGSEGGSVFTWDTDMAFYLAPMAPRSLSREDHSIFGTFSLFVTLYNRLQARMTLTHRK